MIETVTLTVAQSKRLIAKAVAVLPEVRTARTKGILVVSTGSTNAYVAEEILGSAIEKRGFLTGHYRPAGPTAKALNLPPRLPDLILRKGEAVSDKNKFEIVHEMGPSDVFIKGANALNYEKGVAGIVLSDPKGGTIGGVIGPITAKGVQLIIPVGLEKLVAHDIGETWRKMNLGLERNGPLGLFPTQGKIVTEIEAMQVLFGIQVIHIASGGVFGAEGATTLLLDSSEDQLRSIRGFLAGIQGEQAY